MNLLKRMNLPNSTIRSIILIAVALAAGSCRKSHPVENNITPITHASYNNEDGGYNEALIRTEQNNLELRLAGDQTVLHVFAYCGDFDNVQKVIEKGIDVNSTDEMKRTPLMMACISVENRQNTSKIVKYLLSKGADILNKDIKGATALDYCVFSDTPEALSILLSKLKYKDFSKENLIKLAIKHRSKKCLRVLHNG